MPTVTANHHVCVRSIDVDGREHIDRFLAAPSLSGLAALTRRLAPYPGVVAVAEPTSMTWLSLSIAVSEAGGQLALLGSRHSARLPGAIVGKNKSDVIDADVLARAGDVFTLRPMPVVTPAQLALRRAVTRRGAAVIDGNRYWRRLMSLARWAFPDVWTAFGGSLPTATAVLGRWPHLAQLGAARTERVERRVYDSGGEVLRLCLEPSGVGGAGPAGHHVRGYQMVCVSEGVSNLKEMDCERDQAGAQAGAGAGA